MDFSVLATKHNCVTNHSFFLLVAPVLHEDLQILYKGFETLTVVLLAFIELQSGHGVVFMHSTVLFGLFQYDVLFNLLHVHLNFALCELKSFKNVQSFVFYPHFQGANLDVLLLIVQGTV